MKRRLCFRFLESGLSPSGHTVPNLIVILGEAGELWRADKSRPSQVPVLKTRARSQAERRNQ